MIFFRVNMKILNLLQRFNINEID